MSNISATSLTGPRSNPSFFGTLIERFKAFIERRAAAEALRAMDDRQLHDLGVTRGDIEYLAKTGNAPRS